MFLFKCILLIVVGLASCQDSSSVSSKTVPSTPSAVVETKLLTKLFDNLKHHAISIPQFFREAMKKLMDRHKVKITYEIYNTREGKVVFIPVDSARNHYFPGK
jgi:hypothetical protein